MVLFRREKDRKKIHRFYDSADTMALKRSLSIHDHNFSFLDTLEYGKEEVCGSLKGV